MGISADQVGRQLEFADANALGFPLLSDPGRGIAQSFGVVRRRPLPNKRRTFVIDRDGSVLRTVRAKLNMRIHADRALETLREAINS